MNVGFNCHFPDETLERYSMGKLSPSDCAPLEEHLLVCPACQLRLDAAADYILVAKAAIAALEPHPPASAHRVPPGKAITAAGVAALTMLLLLPL
jgi:hypothetical protein